MLSCKVLVADEVPNASSEKDFSKGKRKRRRKKGGEKAVVSDLNGFTTWKKRVRKTMKLTLQQRKDSYRFTSLTSAIFGLVEGTEFKDVRRESR